MGCYERRIMKKVIEINKTYKIKKCVDHQGIGGKEILIEKELLPDEVFEQSWAGNIACYNYCMRRPGNYLDNFGKKLYYGHVGNLGYVVCEDELITTAAESCKERIERFLFGGRK